jgi:hypothetical protein
MAQQPLDPNMTVNGAPDASSPPATGVGEAPPFLETAAKMMDPAKLATLGQRLKSRFETYERERRIAEIKWMRNARQYLGIHDPEIEQKMDPNRSKAYPRITRVKVVSMVSRLMNLLFPAGDKNWSVEPSPVPNLSPEDLNSVLQALFEATQGQMTDQDIEEGVMAFAKERARNLEQEVEDQLDELGGDRTISYVSLCKQIIKCGVTYGIGVLKGPMARKQVQRSWARDPMSGQFVPQVYEVERPQFEFVNIWDYYPDMTAKTFSQMDGQFQRHVMSRHQVRKLADREDFFGEVIKSYLNAHPDGNYKRRTYETELKSMGVALNTGDQTGRKYELIQWFGYVSAQDLILAGVEVPEQFRNEEVEADVWLIDNVVIKADINPWIELDTGYKVNMYHQFIFEEDETSITGNGLPNIMRDSQMSITAATMMLMDNASVVCGPNLELNTDLLRMDQDLKSIAPYKIWYREGLGAEANQPAVREIKIDSHINELTQVINLFQGFADAETFVNQATGGDMQRGPSEPFRTATGASMLRGDAALPFKDVVRNFDLFTESVITSLVAFNQQFNPKESIRGDFQVQAKGSTSLIAKEVRGVQLDQFAQTLRPDEIPYIDTYELLKERAAVRDLTESIVVSRDEAERVKQSQADQQQKQGAQQDELIRAQIRAELADALKAVTQANKNQAAANLDMVEPVNKLLGGLESGISEPRTGAAAPNEQPANTQPE